MKGLFLLLALLFTLIFVPVNGRPRKARRNRRKVKKALKAPKRPLFDYFDSFSTEESCVKLPSLQPEIKEEMVPLRLLRHKSHISSDSFDIDKHRPREYHVKGERYVQMRINSMDELKEHYRKHGKTDLAKEVEDMKIDIQNAAKKDLDFAKHVEKAVDHWLEYIGGLDQYNEDVTYCRVDLTPEEPAPYPGYFRSPFHEGLPLTMPVTDEYYSHRERTTLRS